MNWSLPFCQGLITIYNVLDPRIWVFFHMKLEIVQEHFYPSLFYSLQIGLASTSLILIKGASKASNHMHEIFSSEQSF